MNKIEGTLLYVQVQKPVKAYQTPGTPTKPDEYKASVAIVDEDVLDAFEEYAKEIDAKISIKKVKVADFPALYKCDVPEGAGKNVWVLTFRKSTELGKTGKPVPDQYRPRVYQRKGKEGTLVDVTQTVLPANGSKGIVSLEIFTRANGTSSIYLKNILVTDMIEYVKAEGSGEAYEPGSEFGDTEGAPVAEKPASKPAAAPKASTKAKPAAKKVEETEEFVDDELPDDSPF